MEKQLRPERGETAPEWRRNSSSFRDSSPRGPRNSSSSGRRNSSYQRSEKQLQLQRSEKQLQLQRSENSSAPASEVEKGGSAPLQRKMNLVQIKMKTPNQMISVPLPMPKKDQMNGVDILPKCTVAHEQMKNWQEKEKEKKCVNGVITNVNLKEVWNPKIRMIIRPQINEPMEKNETRKDK